MYNQQKEFSARYGHQLQTLRAEVSTRTNDILCLMNQKELRATESAQAASASLAEASTGGCREKNALVRRKKTIQVRKKNVPFTEVTCIITTLVFMYL